MFTIGEFSKLSRVSARMLRHYDRIGLLSPANVGEENGYRYYEASQPVSYTHLAARECGLTAPGCPLCHISKDISTWLPRWKLFISGRIRQRT